MEFLGLEVELDSQIPEGHILVGDQMIPTQSRIPVEENPDVDIATHEPTGVNVYDDFYMKRLRRYLGHDPRQKRFW